METTSIPACIGFIMDGNRRWAKEHGLQTMEGHRKGYEVIQRMTDIFLKRGIRHMVCYAFSTENWNRSEEEVSYLMQLLEEGIREMKQSVSKEVSIRFIGERERLPESLAREIAEIEATEVVDAKLTIWLALSYGGRSEIVHAVNRVVSEGVEVTEQSFEKYLWTNGMPDPDMIIRTSGEVRLSNFLLWQCAYSELFFVDTYWPDFGETEFQSILEQYGKRKRRKGV